MVLDLLGETSPVRGVFWTLLGVSFWVGGIVLAHYFWERYRGGEGE